MQKKQFLSPKAFLQDCFFSVEKNAAFSLGKKLSTQWQNFPTPVTTRGDVCMCGSGNTPETRGSAFVIYEDIFDAKNACDHLSGFNVCNRYLVVLYYQPNKVQCVASDVTVIVIRLNIWIYWVPLCEHSYYSSI